MITLLIILIINTFNGYILGGSIWEIVCYSYGKIWCMIIRENKHYVREVIMEKLAEVLKIFIEKHLMPSVISIAGSIITLLFISDSSWILLKIGKILFLCLAFCIYFIIIQIFHNVVKYVKNVQKSTSYRRYKNEQISVEINEIIDKTNEFIDNLLPEDKDILLTFMRNGNKILIAGERIGPLYGRLLENTNIMNISIYRGNIKSFDKNIYWITDDLKQSLNAGMLPVGLINQYKIKDNVYQELKKIYNIKGKLGNF